MGKVLFMRKGEIHTAPTNVLYLYNEGDECEGVTGGWAAPAMLSGNSSYAFDCSNSYGTSERTKNADNLHIKATWTHATNNGICAASFWTKKGIDLTDYSTLKVKTDVIAPNSGIWIHNQNPLTTTVGVDSASMLVKKVAVTTLGENEVSVDISDLDGVYYPGIGVAGWEAGIRTKESKTYKIWLE